MHVSITQESFESLATCWMTFRGQLRWQPLFVLPVWLKVWWQNFGSGFELYLGAVRQGERIIGIAPLLIREGNASIIGSADVCDYLDFIVAPGSENDFFNALLDDLTKRGVHRLDPGPLRPDSTVLTHLIDIAKSRKYAVSCRDEAVSVEMDLPATWEEYLEMLDKKQRHELRRKLRRLFGAGDVVYRCLKTGQEVSSFMDTFLKLFVLSRQEKADFLSPKMESFFRSLAKAMTEAGLLRFGILELDRSPVAMTLGFDYDDSLYLYNSAYDPRYNYLSVGLLCKALCIKESIQDGKKKFDFLKGDETYKYHLGGRGVPLYRCGITLA